MKGESERRFAETKMNHTSSRSHCVFRLYLEVPTANSQVKLCSAINLIDLAGSEGVAKSDIDGERLKEGSSINKSLLAMYNVISKLNKGDGFVCFRESKLTRILQPYLGGNSLTAIVSTVSPLLSNCQESLNTLRFALCAGGIKNNVMVNVKDSSKPISLEDFQTEIAKLYSERDSLLLEVKNSEAVVLAAEADFEAKIVELEEVYEAQKQALGLQKEICLLRQQKKAELEKGRIELGQSKVQLDQQKKLLQELLSQDSATDLELQRRELESKRLQVTNATIALKQQHVELSTSLVSLTTQIGQKTALLTQLQQRTTFLAKSVHSFNNAISTQQDLLEKSATKAKLKKEEDSAMFRAIELAKQETKIISLVVQAEMIERERRDREEVDRRRKIRAQELKYVLKVCQNSGVEGLEILDGVSFKDTSVDGSEYFGALSWTMEESERGSVKSLSINGENSTHASQPQNKFFSLCEGVKGQKFARPSVQFGPQEGTNHDVDVMSAFEADLFNCARAGGAKSTPRVEDLTTNDNSTLGKRSVTRSISSQIANHSSKNRYVISN